MINCVAVRPSYTHRMIPKRISRISWLFIVDSAHAMQSMSWKSRSNVLANQSKQGSVWAANREWEKVITATICRQNMEDQISLHCSEGSRRCGLHQQIHRLDGPYVQSTCTSCSCGSYIVSPIIGHFLESPGWQVPNIVVRSASSHWWTDIRTWQWSEDSSFSWTH